jgi:tetratricopeptide (TPR) repeat protein
MVGRMTAFALLFGALALAAPRVQAAAPQDAALNADLLHIALDWERIKFQGQDHDLQEKQMAGVAQHAAEIAQRYPGRPEAQIWLGIIISEQASMASENSSPFKALGFAKQARDILEKVEKVDPVVLDAGAPTSLGVLYYRVPGFPLGFGDNAKARQLLQEAVANAPNGLDANYFYGDFLYQQHEYAAAEKVLRHALSLPPHPERPLWDKSRRLVIQELLAKIAKAAS